MVHCKLQAGDSGTARARVCGVYARVVRLVWCCAIVIISNMKLDLPPSIRRLIAACHWVVWRLGLQVTGTCF